MRAIEAGVDLVHTIPSDATAAQAADRMHQRAVGCLVVVDLEGRAVGIVTDRDLCLRAVAAERPQPYLAPVLELMSAPLHWLPPDASVADAVRSMREHCVRRLPLCEGGRPVGLVALDDLTEALARGLLDLETGVQNRRAEELGQRRVDRVLLRLGGMRERLRAAGWQAREELLGDLDRLEDLILGRGRHA